MTGPENDMAALRRLGLDAAPTSAPQPHATDAELARMGADDDSPSLAGAYRHVAACAACRARLLESAALVQKLATISREHGLSAPAPALPDRPAVDASRAVESSGAPASVSVARLVPRRRLFFALAAAAAVALAIGARSLRRGPIDPIAIAQRPYAGMMGAGEAEPMGIAAEDADVELSFSAPPGDGAALLVMDAAGRALAPLRWFTQAEGGRLVTVVAPRTFVPHGGGAIGLVVVGDPARVREALEATPAPGSSLDSTERAVRERGGIRVERIAIGAGAP